MYDVRFWGPAVAAQKVKIRPGGSITLTNGMSASVKLKWVGVLTRFLGSVATRPLPAFSIISGVSGAIDSMARGLAVDLAPIRVNVVSSGVILTEVSPSVPPSEHMSKPIVRGLQFFDKHPPQVLERIHSMKDTLPVKHVGTPEEIAEAYLFLMK